MGANGVIFGRLAKSCPSITSFKLDERIFQSFFLSIRSCVVVKRSKSTYFRILLDLQSS